ncbi:MAG: cyclic nucleotide-binding domain-containing protein [Gammaproteobacteria bacterium]|nr:cyclic nucleotide-binding domain-containing protein [Gammaproteobacteria bacterium]
MALDQDQLAERLRLLVPINNLPGSLQERILNSADVIELKKRDFLFQQGDRDKFSFYLIEGDIEMYADDQLIKKVHGGDAASFHPLAQLQPRQMSAQARTKVSVLRVDRALLDKLLSVEQSDKNASTPDSPAIEVTEIETDADSDWLTTMLQSDLFVRVPPSNIQTLLETLEPIEVKAGDVVVEQGGPGDYYYAIQSGRCEVSRRSGDNKRAIKLAELSAGDTFGEEALVSNTRRNATVTMLTDGELARLTKDDFLRLVTEPILQTITIDAAETMVQEGAQWLDVRFPEEHEANGMPDSLNIPLNLLRSRHKDLDRARTYLIYCDTGGRSSTAAFLLAGLGFEVFHVKDGGVSEALPESANKTAAPKAAPAPAVNETDAMVEADVRAATLTTEFEKANLQLEEARRLMAEAERAKAEADRYVKEKLEAERARVNAEAERAEATLADAERLKSEIEKQKAAAEEDSARRHAEQEAKLAQMQSEAEARLREKEQQLEETYRRNAKELEKLQAVHAETARELDVARQEVADTAKASEERLKAAEVLETTLEMEKAQVAKDLEEAQSKLAEMAAESEQRMVQAASLESTLKQKEMDAARALLKREEALRDKLQKEIAEERRKLESEFARTSAELENARREKQAAEAAREAATQEASQIIEEYKETHSKLRAEQEQALLEERQKLEADAARIKAALEETNRARQAAEATKQQAERELAAIREQAQRPDASKIDLRGEIAAVEERATRASRELEDARAAEASVALDQQNNEKLLENTLENHMELSRTLKDELNEWLAENKAKEEEVQRNITERKRSDADRIKQRASKARQSTEAHDRALIEELQAQVR